MKRGLIIIIGIAVLVVAGILIFVLFSSNKVECQNPQYCFSEHLETCKEYKQENYSDLDALVNFKGEVYMNSEVTGEKKNGRCGIYFEILKTTNPKDSWAESKSATCYVTEEILENIDPINIFRDYCKGNFASAAIQECELTGTETDSLGRTKYKTSCGSEENKENVIKVNSTIDPDDLCRRINKDYPTSKSDYSDALDCLNTLRIIYNSHNKNNILLCENLEYTSGVEACQDSFNNYPNYISWYAEIVQNYTREGII